MNVSECFTDMGYSGEITLGAPPLKSLAFYQAELAFPFLSMK